MKNIASFFKLTSINSRIILGALIIVSSFMLLTGITLSNTFYHSAYSALKERLTGQIYLLMAEREYLLTNTATDSQSIAIKTFFNPLHASSHLSAYITQSDGKMLWQSDSKKNTLISNLIPIADKNTHGKKLFQTYSIDNKPYITLSVVIFWDLKAASFPLIYHISEDLSQLNNKVADYQQRLWTHLIIMSLFLFISLFLILRWGLKPLRDVEQEIKAVEQGKQERIQQSYPKELTALTHTINQLVEYEHQQQVRYQNALADLAHSLKTPLAIIRGQEFNKKNPQQYINTIDNAVDRMDTIVEYQLQRASSIHPSPHIHFLVLAPVVTVLVESMKKIYQEKNISFKINLVPNIQLKIDEGDFMEVLGNLLDNACKWCKDSIELTIITNTENNKHYIQLIISDNGPGIHPEMIEEISKRGIRADELTPGHGVGLAIVKDVLSVYQARIKFNSSSKGLTIVVDFPT